MSIYFIYCYYIYILSSATFSFDVNFQRAGNVNLHVVTETSPQRPVQTSPQQQPVQTSPQQEPGQTSPQQEPVQSSPQRPISLPLDLSSPGINIVYYYPVL